MKIEGVQKIFQVTKSNPPPEKEIEMISIQPLHPCERLRRRERRSKTKKRRRKT